MLSAATLDLILQAIAALITLEPSLVAEVQAILPEIQAVFAGAKATEVQVQALDDLTTQVNAKVAALGG